MDSLPEVHCPLCGASAFWNCRAWGREVHRCPVCDLRFVSPMYWLTSAQEVARYRLHFNRIEDEGYVRFLMPVVDCLKRHSVAGRVLDYGAGPSPVLVDLLRRQGYEASGYDPNFDAGSPSLDCTGGDGFDAVVSTEVFEHFREPARELDRVVSMLKPGGLLVVMTALATADVRMDSWHYANDATHIVFYSEETFRYIARRWGFEHVEGVGARLMVLRLRSLPCGCGGSGQG